MRKLLLPITLFLFLSSCVKQYTNRYYIENNSSHSIIILNFKNNIIDSVFLSPTADTCNKYTSYAHPTYLYDFFRRTIHRELSDSAKIYFDTSKVLNFYSMPSVSEPIDRNILDVEHSFQKQRCSKDGESCNFIYEITDEDYERAGWIVE